MKQSQNIKSEVEELDTKVHVKTDYAESSVNTKSALFVNAATCSELDDSWMVKIKNTDRYCIKLQHIYTYI